MASNVFVVDSSARRHQIKTTPGTYLRDVLEEACKKFNKDPEQFELLDSSRPPKSVNLSLTWRLSGLSGGAKLQLVQSSRSPAVLPVAIQLPESLGGERLSDKFPSTTPFWQVLRKFEDAVAGTPAKRLNITQRGIPSTDAGTGRLVYEQPTLNIMGRELGDFVELQKTFRQLGFNSGNVLIRLNFKNSGTPMEEAMKTISEYFSSTEPATTGSRGEPAVAEPTRSGDVTMRSAHSAPPGNLTSVPDPDAAGPVTAADEDAGQDPSGDTIMTPPPPPSELYPHVDDAVIASSSETPQAPSTTRTPSQSMASADVPASDTPATQFTVYKPSSNPTPRAAREAFNPADFEPSVEHAKSHQATLNRASQNRRLESDAALSASNEARQAQLMSIKSAAIRVRFPDQMMIDLEINGTDTAECLYETVKDLMESPNESFVLRFTGPKAQPIVLERQGKQKLIQGLGMSGRILVTMLWENNVSLEARQQPVLKSSVRQQAQELVVALPDAADENKSKSNADGKKPEKELVSERKERNKGDVEARMKKFLGFGKK